MAGGGARANAGRPPRARAMRQALEQAKAEGGYVPPKRPHFGSAREFALWALNAPDLEVDMDQKMRAMQALLTVEKSDPSKAKPAVSDDVGGLYAPRQVRGFRVVNGADA